MARINGLLLAERLIPGGVADYLQALRDQGLAWDAVARRLENEHDITVTSETVRTWARQLDIPTSTPREPAA